jgi:hypothetical protein
MFPNIFALPRSETDLETYTRGSYTQRQTTKLYVGIPKEMGNERYRTIGGIFPFQHERKIGAWAPLTFPSCTARKWLSSACRFVIEFPVKERNSAGVICEWLHGVYGYRQYQKVGEATICSGLWEMTWQVTTTSVTQSGSRAKLFARGFNAFLPQRHFKVLQRWQICIDRDRDFVEK